MAETRAPDTVLIVEDDPAHAEALRRSLTTAGYHVRWADSVSAFSATEQDHDTTLVLADLKLPDGTAFDILNRAQNRPVLLMTSHGDEESAVLAIKRGALDYIVKSVSTFHEMPRLVERALRDWEHIQQRKRAEVALQESEARYRLLFETIGQGVLYHDCHGTIVSANPAAARILGIAQEQLLGLHARDPRWQALDEDGKPLPSDQHPSLVALRTGEPVRDRLMGVLASSPQSYRWILVSATPQFHPMETRPYQVYTAFTDITDLRRAQEQRLDMERRMLHVQKLESLGVLAGGVAHDFNNILVAILGHADLALESLPTEARARESLTEISNAAHRAADLSRQILAYAGRGQFLVQEIHLSGLVTEMAQLLSTSISKKARLNLELPQGLPTLHGDATQIRQVAMNLITNASEALGDQPGEITVVTGHTQCSEEFLTQIAPQENLPPGDYLFLEVRDTGCGMDSATLARIFEPFFTTKFTGRGLGMAALIGIVRAHHGAITISTCQGRGSCFRVFFPTGIGPSRAKPASSHRPDWKGGGRVLLVDDESTIRSVGRKMLEACGFEVDTARDGHEALEKCASTAYDCVILDLTMPAMDGAETLARLRELRAETRVLMSSGYAEQELMARFSNQEVSGFIQKPYSLSMLREALRAALRR